MTSKGWNLLTCSVNERHLLPSICGLMGILFLTLLSQLQVGAQQTNCVSAPEGIVSWWKAEQNALDELGIHNGETPFGIAYAEGFVGGAFDFDGSQRRVTVPDSPEFMLTNAMTLEAWVYPRAYQGFITFRGDNRGGLDTWTLDAYEPGHVTFTIIDETNGFTRLLAPLTLNQWQHVAATWERTSGEMKLYINGALTSQTNSSIIPIAELNSDAAVGIGNHGGIFHQFPFNGLIDELAIYNRALSAERIAVIYEAGSAGKCAPEKPEVVPGDKVEWPVVSGGNGHSYQPFLAQNGISWEDANAMATALGGHLATVTNAAENDFAYSLVSSEDAYWFIDGWGNGLGPWMGGLQAEGATEPVGGWGWVTGEPFEYTAWYPGEPNDYYEGVNENRIHLFGYRTLKGSWWNDTADVLGPNSPYMNGFIVEWSPENTQPIADASTTLPLFISPDNTNAMVILDGSRSYDPDNDSLTYAWYRMAGRVSPLIATGVVATVQLPVGAHSIRLTVDDGMATASDTLMVDVITLSEAAERLLQAVTESGTGNGQSLIATLRAALASIDRSNPTAAINQLRAFQNQVQAQVASVDPELAAEFIEQAQDIIDALTEGGLDSKGPKMAAKHVNGQMKLEFSGNDQRIYVIEASSNMVDWETVGVATRVDDGQFEFNDSSVTEHGVRYYRVVEP